MIKYAVGFQLTHPEEEPFSSIVACYRNYISEVFFSWRGMPSGRSNININHELTDKTVQQRIEKELKVIKDMGIKLDLLFNGNCYGANSLSVMLQNNVCSIINYLNKVVGGIDVVTTTSPAIAHMVKTNFPEIDVRASVNMKIGTIKGMEYLSSLFDSFCVERERNRDLSYLKMLKDWADENNKKLILLANSGCFAHCSGQIFHDNNVAHEAEIEKVENIQDFNPYVCWRSLKDRKNWVKVLQNTWVRPEDVDKYEGLIDTVKLATRIHSLPGLVIDAYSRRSYFGNTLDLFEPTLSSAIAPFIINNSAFPEDWFEKTTKCDKICNKCNYCQEVLDKVLMNTEG